MFILHEHHAISTAVANKSSIRIGDQAAGLYVEVEDGRIISFFQHLGVKTTR
jgi:hypothetical protein